LLSVCFNFYHGGTAGGLGPPHYRSFRITLSLDIPHSAGLLWTSENSVAETSSTWQYTTLTRYRCPWPRWDANTQPQQGSGRRPTP